MTYFSLIKLSRLTIKVCDTSLLSHGNTDQFGNSIHNLVSLSWLNEGRKMYGDTWRRVQRTTCAFYFIFCSLLFFSSIKTATPCRVLGASIFAFGIWTRGRCLFLYSSEIRFRYELLLVHQLLNSFTSPETMSNHLHAPSPFISEPSYPHVLWDQFSHPLAPQTWPNHHQYYYTCCICIQKIKWVHFLNSVTHRQLTVIVLVESWNRH